MNTSSMNCHPKRPRVTPDTSAMPISSSRLGAHTPDSTRMSNSTPPTATNAMVPVFAREDSVSSGSREAL